MTEVKGQIESLKKIRSELNRNGIWRFDSIADINEFIRDYETERKEIIRQVEQEFDSEFDQLLVDRTNFREIYEKLRASENLKLQSKIKGLENRYNRIKSKSSNPVFFVISYPLLVLINLKKKHFLKHFNRIILSKTFKTEQKLWTITKKVRLYSMERDQIIQNRSLPGLREVDSAKGVVDSLNTLIAGAIGENRVVKELKKLSDNFILLNDFSIRFDRPIYNRKEDDKIFSIQIDHVLVTNSGIFVIETKNWSKKSMERLDFRSPVQQIRRTSYALFVLLNSDSGRSYVSLNPHHWGEKKIPIRNLIVMINNRPKEKFRYVEVVTLRELNKYVSNFDPIFDDNEVTSIAEYLESQLPAT